MAGWSAPLPSSRLRCTCSNERIPRRADLTKASPLLRSHRRPRHPETVREMLDAIPGAGDLKVQGQPFPGPARQSLPGRRASALRSPDDAPDLDGTTPEAADSGKPPPTTPRSSNAGTPIRTSSGPTWRRGSRHYRQATPRRHTGTAAGDHFGDRSREASEFHQRALRAVGSAGHRAVRESPGATDITFITGVLAHSGSRRRKALAAGLAMVDEITATFVVAICYTDTGRSRGSRQISPPLSVIFSRTIRFTCSLCW